MRCVWLFLRVKRLFFFELTAVVNKGWGEELRPTIGQAQQYVPATTVRAVSIEITKLLRISYFHTCTCSFLLPAAVILSGKYSV